MQPPAFTPVDTKRQALLPSFFSDPHQHPKHRLRYLLVGGALCRVAKFPGRWIQSAALFIVQEPCGFD